MKLERKKQLFAGYVHYWLVKLKLHKKNIVTNGVDRRINCRAVTTQLDGKHYKIDFNPKALRSNNMILHVCLHEVGHLLHKWVGKNSSHEQFAEHWALKTAKEHYPKQYRLMVNRTIKEVKEGLHDKDHVEGYYEALKQLGELKD